MIWLFFYILCIALALSVLAFFCLQKFRKKIRFGIAFLLFILIVFSGFSFLLSLEDMPAESSRVITREEIDSWQIKKKIPEKRHHFTSGYWKLTWNLFVKMIECDKKNHRFLSVLDLQSKLQNFEPLRLELK